jgi:hypothetical protein
MKRMKSVLTSIPPSPTFLVMRKYIGPRCQHTPYSFYVNAPVVTNYQKISIYYSYHPFGWVAVFFEANWAHLPAVTYLAPSCGKVTGVGCQVSD